MSDLRRPLQDPFHLLYAENHHWLQGWLRRRLDCQADAADLTHDTFLRTLKSPHLGHINEPRAFLCLIAKRVLCTFWRRHELERAYMDALASLPGEFIPSEEEFALLREALETIDAMLDGLPARIRHAFLLNRLEGLTHRQIAAQLDVSLATVERWIKQAITQCYLAQVMRG
ncbi:sigma-70 family RNA polymerase sigma factor [Pseudomonas sp. Marseille-Q1929]|uniref:sigma-70 family RNA polymerase sigma factor n=1 Tax=Pseudomonas sp. Marseille-Q1929 TaxID=2730402 RepID=UPI001A8C3EFF|nr:sigma-70 family RNA polymerase sigma factor [Pseudomonas sp. Marseille-Q1929]MBO0491791.1 sigma-70 family RNA polymerase sigma factor [Pseudomonas sp. Marseille-Q1929]